MKKIIGGYIFKTLNSDEIRKRHALDVHPPLKKGEYIKDTHPTNIQKEQIDAGKKQIMENYFYRSSFTREMIICFIHLSST